MPGLKAFVAAVFGGIGSIPGAVIGGFIIGICESHIKGAGATTFSDAFTFALLIVVLAPPELVQEFAAEGTPMLLALLALGNLSFWLCDRALTAITPLYRQRIAPRLKKKF